MKRFGVVSHDIKATAFLRAFGTECADDDVTTQLRGSTNVPDTREPIFRFGQNVKDGAAVPDIV